MEKILILITYQKFINSIINLSIIQLIMNDQLQKLFVVGGVLAAGYFVFNKMTSEALPLDLTTRISQQIKHQMLIATINFAQGAKLNIDKIKSTNPQKVEEVLTYFRTKLAQIYEQKEQLILGKYSYTKDKYSSSLKKYESNPKIAKIQQQILEMMERAVNGQIPNLSVDKKVKAAFTKKQMKKIYEEMSKMILVALISKLQQQKAKNPYFDSNNDTQFKKIIRELNIYAKKIEFFERKGFKPEWGCPNENFFKYNESLKLEDPQYKKQMTRLQQIYETVVDVAAKDPSAVNIQKLSEFYEKKVQEPKQQIPVKAKHPLKKQINIQKAQIVQPIKVQPIIVQQKKEQIKQEHPKQQNIVNVAAQTKSELGIDQAKIEENKEQKLVNNLQSRAKSLAQPLEKIEVEAHNENKIGIDEVPSDAHELNQQLKHESENVVSESADHEEAKNQGESNVSVDGEAKKEQIQYSEQQKNEIHHSEQQKNDSENIPEQNLEVKAE